MNTNSHNGLKILVSAVQFRPGTPGKAESLGETGCREASRASNAFAVFAGTGTTTVQAELGAVAR